MGNDVFNCKADACAWPELVYRFVEHFRWEPNRLCDTVKDFQCAIRRHEVPLNYLFLLLLRWSRPETVRAVVGSFGIADDVPLGRLRLMAAEDTGYTQPDARIESETTRIYIENKIGSKLDLVQVQKYILLHAEADRRHGAKQPYLLVLTPGPFAKSWTPRKGAPEDLDVECFLRTQMNDAPLENLRSCAGLKTLDKYADGYDNVKKSIRYGAATWKLVGRCRAGICDELSHAGDHEVERSIMSDFVAELDRRGLMV